MFTRAAQAGSHRRLGAMFVATALTAPFAASAQDGLFGYEQWVRTRDEGNDYYVTLRNDNTVSLRKRVNGATACVILCARFQRVQRSPVGRTNIISGASL
jgi:hypothetical protein